MNIFQVHLLHGTSTGRCGFRCRVMISCINDLGELRLRDAPTVGEKARSDQVLSEKRVGFSLGLTILICRASVVGGDCCDLRFQILLLNPKGAHCRNALNVYKALQRHGHRVPFERQWIFERVPFDPVAFWTYEKHPTAPPVPVDTISQIEKRKGHCS